MVVAWLRLALRIDSSHSLKEKRRVLHGLIERVRRKYQVAVAEVDDADLHNVATVGIAAVSNSAVHAGSILDKVLDLIDAEPEVEIEGVDRESLHL